MNSLKPNKELLQKTLRHIEKHRDRWKQSNYRCRSGMCFAGHAAILGGSKWTNPRSPTGIMVKPLGRHPMEAVWVRARKLLGLNEDQAAALFFSRNTLTTIRRMVREYSR